MVSLQQFIFIPSLPNTGDCTEFGPKGITNFIKKNKIKKKKFRAADFRTAVNFLDKPAGHHTRGPSSPERRPPRSPTLSLRAAVPTKGDGIGPWVSIRE